MNAEKVKGLLPVDDTDNAQTVDSAAELEKAKHTADVWAGRAKSQAEKIKSLEAELRELRAKKQAEETVSGLSEEERADIPQDYLNTAAKIAAMQSQRSMDEVEKLKAEMQQKDRDYFYGMLGQKYPRLFESVCEGGPNKEIWDRFVGQNRETFQAVIDAKNFERFDQLVQNYYRALGVPNPDEAGHIPLTPDPRITVGGNPAVGAANNAPTGKIYTQDEFMTLNDRVYDEFRSGKISPKEYRDKVGELQNAIREGRIR